MSLNPTANPGLVAPAGWTMEIFSTGASEHHHYFADVQRDGAQVCRLTITGAVSEQEAHRLLAVKARLWIEDYLSRPHTGTTEFGSLT